MAASAARSFALAFRISAEPVRSAATAAARSLVCSSASLASVAARSATRPLTRAYCFSANCLPGGEPLQIGFRHLDRGLRGLSLRLGHLDPRLGLVDLRSRLRDQRHRLLIRPSCPAAR